MNLEWTARQRELHAHFADVGSRYVAPGAGARDEDGQFDYAAWRRVANDGLWGLDVDRRFGGAGGDIWDFIAGFEGLATGAQDFGFVLSCVAHAGFVQLLRTFGTAEQNERFLPTLLGGGVGATAATERKGGSHVAAIETSARPDADGYLVSGEKVHITNAPVADAFVIVGRVPTLGSRDITLFLIERSTPGVSLGILEDLLGQRTSPTASICLADVSVPSSNVVGDPGAGLEILYSMLAFDRLMYGIAVAGYLAPVIHRAMARASSRTAFGEPLASHQYIQEKIVNMKMTMETSRWLAYSAAAKLEVGVRDARCDASLAKLAAAEGAVAAALESIQIFGHTGYERGARSERLLRDVVALRLAGGTSEIQKLNIFKQLQLQHSEMGRDLVSERA